MALRGYLIVYNNLCWAMGQLLANGVLKALVNNDTEWSYRLPFAIQWVWPLPLFVLVSFSPESPWWLARRERYGEAAINLHRLSTRAESEVQNTLAQIVYTIRLEKASTARRNALVASARETQTKSIGVHRVPGWISRRFVCQFISSHLFLTTDSKFGARTLFTFSRPWLTLHAIIGPPIRHKLLGLFPRSRQTTDRNLLRGFCRANALRRTICVRYVFERQDLSFVASSQIETKARK